MEMAKARLTDFTSAATGPDPVSIAPAVASLTKAPTRPSSPHVSLYLAKTVQKEIKRIALDMDLRPHDAYLQAIDLFLAKHGRPTVAELTERE
jgi:hypothetical protein